jgi:hypothetical protein
MSGKGEGDRYDIELQTHTHAHTHAYTHVHTYSHTYKMTKKRHMHTALTTNELIIRSEQEGKT